ncbi:STM4012 family radical SAM protein [Tuwongella immobilis]|uniref:Radical SAM core domain-containing protein n=1 Tax=Tuwongella immobilis TaxID=692036 RepID=A0A6C2YRE3_9BACT|nr:STM4012 family radical SAM protein [Tuwongella immobilis]VIP04228.1 coproporphyrinogen iii oxidase : Coproporphyrinogen III oxidase family protein OS=Myxococcus xanthus (strain DK 1622) GN=MXAN_2888 PE=4 SV=1: Radical_SAM: HemN_C [Tuwongella immobilis]VTS05820.1 coproporphyrinogen iii oxidase : Coproporphyrinogen III oxidase family protein OS=Myxococcus xanthus (strain DK 1622) GN=MXAN_2888 PE=4 SV=1: Radical_SAM: HemN_C [Tuwongella immobilis]
MNPIPTLSDLTARLSRTPYQGYVYAYPHKTAYRPLTPPRSLASVWSEQPQDSLFLYVHIPFCGMRCGFCNLFTQANPVDSLVTLYRDALDRQMLRTRAALPDARFARLAIGGGTPTYLDLPDLIGLFERMRTIFGVDPRQIPTGIEVSPETVTPEKLAFLREIGVQRISMGVQSFRENETKHAGRPQKLATVHTAIEAITAQRFPIRNLDLIYGMPEQTLDTWDDSLRQTLAIRPEEIYLYPLYVRPLTGLGKSDREWDDIRIACYRHAVGVLTNAGYRQVSMRMFRLAELPHDSGPDYCCQRDGMLGLGCGARSYTAGLHYSGEYAVGSQSVRSILRDYVARSDADFDRVDFGVELDAVEQRRRWLLQSLLVAEGMSREFYRQRFSSDALDDFPELWELPESGLASITDLHITLTALGLERSDTIGPWLFSPAMRQRMEAYQWR